MTIILRDLKAQVFICFFPSLFPFSLFFCGQACFYADDAFVYVEVGSLGVAEYEAEIFKHPVTQNLIQIVEKKHICSSKCVRKEEDQIILQTKKKTQLIVCILQTDQAKFLCQITTQI